MQRLIWSTCLGVCLTAGEVRADQLLFKNGDRLTGKVLQLEAGAMRFKADSVGEVKVKLAELSTFETEEAVEVHLSDGRVLSEPVARGSGDSARLAGQEIAFETIEEINPEPVRWHGSLAAGVKIERGNTDNQEFHTEMRLNRRSEKYRQDYRLRYEGERTGTGGKKETQERLYHGRAKVDRFLTEKVFAYGLADFERDGVADLDLRSILGIGMGYQVFDTKRLSLAINAGPAWVDERYKDNTRDDNYYSVTAAWDFDSELNDFLSFFHDGSWVPSLEEFNDKQLIKTETGMRIKLIKGLFAEAKVLWELDTEPSGGKERQDTKYLMSLGWGF